MDTLPESLRNAPSVVERRRILKRHLSESSDDLEEYNGVTVLDVDEMEGLGVGSLVSYVNVFGERVQGYVSHFAARSEATQSASLATLLTAVASQMDGRDHQASMGDVFPVMITESGFGYSTHHGKSSIVVLDD